MEKGLAESRPAEWVEFKLREGGDTIGEEWLSVDEIPQKLPASNSSAAAFEGRGNAIGFDFPFEDATMTHFGITGDGLLFLGDSEYFEAYASGDPISAKNVNLVYAMPRLVMKSMDIISKTPFVVTDTETRLCYCSDSEAGLLYVRFENVLLADDVGTLYRWSYDIVLSKNGDISLDFVQLELPDASNSTAKYRLDFLYALRGSRDSDGRINSICASSWDGSISENKTVRLKMSAGNPGEGDRYTFRCPLECSRPTSITAALTTKTRYSGSFSGSVSLQGQYDGLLALVSSDPDWAGRPEDGRYYEVEDWPFVIGDSIAGCPVLLSGSDTVFEIGGLQPQTEYHLFLFPYNDRCVGGPLYREEPVVLDFVTAMAPPALVLAGMEEAALTFAVEENGNRPVLIGAALQNYAAASRVLDISGRSYQKGDTLFYSEKPVENHTGAFLMQAVYAGEVRDGKVRVEGLEPGRPYYFYAWTQETDTQYTVEYFPIAAYTLGTVPLRFDFSNDRVPDDEEVLMPAGWSSTPGMSITFKASTIIAKAEGGKVQTSDEKRALVGALKAGETENLAHGDVISPVFRTSHSSLNVFFRIQCFNTSMGQMQLSQFSPEDTLSLWYRQEGTQAWTLADVKTEISLAYEEDGFATLKAQIPSLEEGKNYQLRLAVAALPPTGNTSRRIALHDVYVEPSLPCLYPEDIVVNDSLTTHRALALEWNNGNRSASVIYSYRAEGESGWSDFETASSSTACLVSPLVSNTMYEFRLRAVCGQGDSSLVKDVGAATLPTVPYVQNFTDSKEIPDGFETGRYSLDGERSDKANGFAMGRYSGEGHTALGVQLSASAQGLNASLFFPPFCLEDMAAPASLRFQYKAWYNASVMNPDYDTVGDRSEARILVLCSSDKQFDTADVVDTLHVQDMGLDFAEYVLDLSERTRQVYVGLMLENPASASTDRNSYFVIDSIEADYEGDIPCLPVEDVNQYDLTTHGITLAWTGYSLEYGIYYTNATTGKVDTVYTTETRYVLEGLEPGTRYNYYIQSFCEEGHRSPGALSERFFFWTQAECAVPEDFAVVEALWNGVRLASRSEAVERVFCIWKKDSRFAKSYVSATADTVVVTGLELEEDYYVCMRAVCHPGDSSLWTDTLAFATVRPECGAPTGLESEVSATDARLSWTPGKNNDYFWLMWRENSASVFDTVQTGFESHELQGLEPATSYVWQVRGICDDAWASPVAGAGFNTEPLANETALSTAFSVEATQGRISIRNLAGIPIDGVEVYDARGSRIYAGEFHVEGNILLPAMEISGKVAVVRVISGVHQAVYKLFVL